MKNKKLKGFSLVLASVCLLGSFAGLAGCGKDDSSSNGEDMTLYWLGGEDGNMNAGFQISDGKYTLSIDEVEEGYDKFSMVIKGDAKADSKGNYKLSADDIKSQEFALGKVYYESKLSGELVKYSSYGEFSLKKLEDGVYVMRGSSKPEIMVKEDKTKGTYLITQYQLFGFEYDVYIPQNSRFASDEELVVDYIFNQNLMQYYDGEKWGDVTESQLDVTVDISTSGAKEMTVKYAGKTYDFSCYVLGENEAVPRINPYVGLLRFSAKQDYVLVGTTAEEYFSNGRFYIYTNNGPQPYSGDDYTVVGWDSSTSRTEMMVAVFVMVDGVRYSCAMDLSVCAEEDLNKGKSLTVIAPRKETGEVTYFVPKGTDLSEGIPVRYQPYSGNVGIGDYLGIATATGYDKDQLGVQLVEIYCEEADCKETIILYVYDETNIIPKDIDFVFNNEDDEDADEITAEMFSIKITYCDGTQETLSGVDQKEYLRINGSDIYYYHPVQVGAETYYYHAYKD